MTLTVTPDPILPDVLHVSPARFSDARGWFSETYNEKAFRDAGLPASFVQDNHSRSEKSGTVRGLHFQRPPHEQSKLVRCVRGRIFDVAVDLRQGSPGFGRYTSVELSAENGKQIFIPAGFAHGFCTLEDGCEVAYKVDAYYAPQSDGGIAFNDPRVGIEWPYPEKLLFLSEKDLRLPVLADLESSPFRYGFGAVA